MFTNATPGIFAIFEFSTDALGAIREWFVRVLPSLPSGEIDTFSIRGFSNDIAVVDPTDKASNTNEPGTWTSTSVAVSEPPTVSVLCAGLLGLGLFWWRRWRKLDLVQYSTQP
jgi:hypothetical protein